VRSSQPVRPLRWPRWPVYKYPQRLGKFGPLVDVQSGSFTSAASRRIARVNAAISRRLLIASAV
jgi:hypothetical protein